MKDKFYTLQIDSRTRKAVADLGPSWAHEADLLVSILDHFLDDYWETLLDRRAIDQCGEGRRKLDNKTVLNIYGERWHVMEKLQAYVARIAKMYFSGIRKVSLIAMADIILNEYIYFVQIGQLCPALIKKEDCVKVTQAECRCISGGTA